MHATCHSKTHQGFLTKLETSTRMATESIRPWIISPPPPTSSKHAERYDCTRLSSQSPNSAFRWRHFSIPGIGSCIVPVDHDSPSSGCHILSRSHSHTPPLYPLGIAHHIMMGCATPETIISSPPGPIFDLRWSIGIRNGIMGWTDYWFEGNHKQC